MSRIGKKIIEIPQGVEVKLDGLLISVKGPKGELERIIRPEITVDIDGNQIKVSPKSDDKFSQSLWGLTRSLIANMIIGVTDGFEKKLEFIGVGYRAAVEKQQDKDKLVLNMGYSHPVEIIAQDNMNFKVEKNVITVFGINKEKVGEIATKIRAVRPPEPYKGKGIHYVGEIIRRKEGKAVAKVAGAAGGA